MRSEGSGDSRGRDDGRERRLDESDARALDAAWEALENGLAEEALARLAPLSEDIGERWVAEAVAWTDLARADGARRAVARAESLCDPEDPGLLWARGELRLASWDLAGARADFARLEELAPDAAVYERLALLADFEGETRKADRFLAEAHLIDPEERPLPAKLSSRDFEEAIGEAVAELPDEFRELLEAVPIVVDPVPDPRAFASNPEDGTPPDLLGLFVGHSLLDRGVEVSGEPTPTIYLFQRNLERICADREDVVREIRVTLYHEIGHLLGFDEEGVDDLGLA